MARTRAARRGQVSADEPASSSRGGQRRTIRRGTGTISAKRAEQWNRKFNEARRWVETTGQFPKPGSSDEHEKALRNFLYDNLPKQCSHRPERWELLNQAFGEGWHLVFCPGFGAGKNGPPKGHITAKRALLWATMLADAEGWVKDKGRYPNRCASDQEERSLGDWLYNNLPGRQAFLPERWQMLNDAFGVGWETDFSPTFGLGRSQKGIKPKNAARWTERFEKVKQMMGETGEFPDARSSDREERVLGKWLYENLPGRAAFQPERWELLNQTFGEGWDRRFCPGFGSRPNGESRLL